MSDSTMTTTDSNVAIALEMGVTNQPDTEALIELLDGELERMDQPEAALTRAGAVMDVLERRISDAKEAVKIARDHQSTMEIAYDAVRAWIYRQMKEHRLQQIKSNDVTVYLKNSTPALRVPNEEAVPDEFWQVKRSVDTKALKAALKEGTLPFAYLEQEEHVAIRRTK